MQVVGDVLGIGRDSGNNFRAAQANIQNPATTDQANQLYGQSQDALKQQQNLVTALGAQNGLNHQNDVYNSLNNVANGTGPNPAQAMLNNSTGQNIANQAAMMAGQRGASANAGLMARQAGQVGGNLQQQAAGQGAALQANQSMNALNQMGGMANQQVANQMSGTSNLNQLTQGAQGQTLNAINGQNSANVGFQNGANAANAGIASGAQGQQGNFLGNIMGGAGAAATKMAEGGKIPEATGPRSRVTSFLKGMSPTQPQMTGMAQAGNGLGNIFGSGIKSLMSMPNDGANITNGLPTGGVIDHRMDNPDLLTQNEMSMQAAPVAQPIDNTDYSQFDKSAMMPKDAAALAKGGKVPALVSPGEQYIPPQDIPKIKAGANPLKTGERIPGKPKFPGNDYRNDTVPKTLQTGGFVIPNKIMQSKNAHKEAVDFVFKHLKNQKK